MIRGPVSTLSLEGAETLSGLPEIPTAVRHREPWEGLPAVLEWALVAYAGSTLGRVFPLPLGETLLGRSPDCGLALPDGEVSRRHACLHVTPGGVRLEDLGSTNGTRLNGIPLHGSATLLAGDRVTVGGHVLKLVAMDPLERAFHETLLDLSTRDPLTGLANRSCVLAELQNRFGLSLRYGRPLSVVICDLDHFKRVNDAHGHAAGDQVLRAFGAWATASLREADLAGRIGGEEFLMVLPETDLAGAQPFAERLRQVVASRPVPVSSGGL
ncbi:MAG: GGDEF domain-containing protein, partial [Acidobacteria bacterium]|nr:GGDEF domain-containing protein [Acidobacteriota bacterium]